MSSSATMTEVRLIDATSGKWTSSFVRSNLPAEDAVLYLAKSSLNVSPVVTTLLGLRSAKGQWLAPNQVVGLVAPEGGPLELRLRFKVPCPGRLKELDKQAFLYFYYQVRNDFTRGDFIKAFSLQQQQQQQNSFRKTNWLARLNGESDESNESARVLLFGLVTQLASMIMVIDILDHGRSQKDVMKNVQSYIPKEIYTSFHEKLIGNSKLKGLADRQVTALVKSQVNSTVLKLNFLSEMEEKFSSYFEDNFEAELDDRASGVCLKVKLVIKPPFKGSLVEESEPTLEIHYYQGKAITESRTLCLIEEICNVSVRGEDLTDLELLRKNGVPVYLKMPFKLEALSFLSHLCGYYRLCEKWTFSLCSDIVYNSLKFNMCYNVHGPVSEEFVKEKFKQKGKNKRGPYLLCQSCNTYDKFVLFYQLESSSNRPNVLLIDKVEDKYCVTIPWTQQSDEANLDFDSLRELVKYLMTLEGHGQQPILKDCLHPSEFDRAPTLLLCRSIAKLRADIIGGGESADQLSEPKLVIPFKQLSRIENLKFEGKFTAVWKGTWQSKKNMRQVVAIKQLKSQFQESKLTDFSHMIYNTLEWDDGTLVKVFATCLHTRFEPMAAVMEYFPLGPLDAYLHDSSLPMQDVDLVEACASLSRALWYLEEKGVKTHGNIRCSNVFVASHSDTAFKVKLGDFGLSDAYDWDHVHWLPVELLIREKPSPQDNTLKGDVWALATTFWQIFSDGNIPQPGVNLLIARSMYVRGDRLVKPERLTLQLDAIYRVMQECWHPLPELRKEPQSIMQDTNQLLYKVFNTRHCHSYVSIDDKSDIEVGSGNLAESGGGGQSSGDTIVSPLEIEANKQQINKSSTPREGPREAAQKLVPMYNNMMKKLAEQSPSCASDSFGDLFNGSLSDHYSDTLPLFPSGSSRPGSSLDGSMFQTDMSQFTSQTSLASYSTLYSMSSIYQLHDESQLELNREFPLGEGNFGIVYKGVMSLPNGEWDQVAVKMLKDTTDLVSSEVAEEMQREYKIMKDLRHNNVVKIKGVLHEHASVLIIMEYVKEGSLDRYLHAHREDHLSRYPGQLFTFAQNIVDGMMYLGQKGIIHRDLAARNILVASDELVKISDFGLARSVVNEDHYVMSSNTNIPVKWLALECLTHKRFTYSSDVWSFGITLWEMFSFGGTPHLHGCESFFKAGAGDEQHQEDMKLWLQYLEDGVRLPKPDRCPSSVYSEVMLPCWSRDPRDRPTFSELRNRLLKVELQVT